jgi:hypothetical protein
MSPPLEAEAVAEGNDDGDTERETNDEAVAVTAPLNDLDPTVERVADAAVVDDLVIFAVEEIVGQAVCDELIFDERVTVLVAPIEREEVEVADDTGVDEAVVDCDITLVITPVNEETCDCVKIPTLEVTLGLVEILFEVEEDDVTDRDVAGDSETTLVSDPITV